MNEYVRNKFVVRSKIIKYTREFFDALGFLEVNNSASSPVDILIDTGKVRITYKAVKIAFR